MMAKKKKNMKPKAQAPEPGNAEQWSKAVHNGSVSKFPLMSLKSYLRFHNISVSGQKDILIWRIKLHVKCSNIQIDGVSPFHLKPAELRKQVAIRNLSPIGSNDELLESLVESLLKERPEERLKEEHKERKKTPASALKLDLNNQPHLLGIQIAETVLELAESDDFEGILSLADQNISKLSPTSMMRKSYLKLSRLIHPDKLGSKFNNATKAFQALVEAFEHLSKHEEPVETQKPAKKGGKAKTKKISRSNQGCFKTQIFCPRCKEEWGTKISGVEPYFYNFMMQGLKTYSCATCLFTFGCVTAIHQCPHCRKNYEYDPNDYHRKITCGNKGCSEEFGFWLHNVSDRVMDTLLEELKQEAWQRLKSREAKQRRAKRAQRHGLKPKGGSLMQMREELYVRNLYDQCPRCGMELEDEDDGILARKEHLQICNDKELIEQNQKRLRLEEEMKSNKEKKQSAQDSVLSLKAWEFLGAHSSSLYLLSEEQIQTQLKDHGLKTSGDKEEMIARLSRKRKQGNNLLLLTDGKSGEGVFPESNSEDTLPPNLYEMEIDQLRAVCASYGLKMRKNASKKTLINSLENKLYGQQAEFLMISNS